MSRIRNFRRAWLAMPAALGSFACGGDATGPVPVVSGPVPVATVAVSPAAHTMFVGDEIHLSASAKDAQGRALTDRAITWTVEPATLANVTADGHVTAIAPGVAQVIAQSEGKRDQATITINARPLAPVASVTLNTHRLDLTFGGPGAILQATVRDADGNVLSRPVTWSSNNPAIAAVTTVEGHVIPRGGGTATVTATVEGKSDAATVVVTELGDFAFDLLYDRWSGSALIEPDIYRVDIRTVDGTPSRVVQIGSTQDATASPNGDRIAFVANAGGHTEIYVGNADGSDLHRVTSGQLSADQPAWSPDGTRIAYRLSAKYSPARIWVMNADGSNARAITNDAPGEHHHPAWSPRQADGSYRIAYAQAAMSDGYLRAQIWTVRDDGTDGRALTDASSGAYDDEPAWSPDGAKVVFVRKGAVNNYDLLIANVQDGAVSSLFSYTLDGTQRAPAWSPDGSLIAFASNHEIDFDGYENQIYTVRPDGSGLRRRTFDNTDKGNPTWIRR